MPHEGYPACGDQCPRLPRAGRRFPYFAEMKITPRRGNGKLTKQVSTGVPSDKSAVGERRIARMTGRDTTFGEVLTAATVDEVLRRIAEGRSRVGNVASAAAPG